MTALMIFNLNKIRQFPNRDLFKDFVKDFQDPIKQIYSNWKNVQNSINSDKKIKFFKTHHVNCEVWRNLVLPIIQTHWE